MNVASQPAPAELDDYIERYESARAAGGDVDVAQFSPDKDHPNYAEIMVELLRVDLEYGWQRGQRDLLARWQSRFADVLRVPDHLQQVAFEEFRLRRQSGEDVSAEQYRTRYGISTDSWPDLPLGDEAASSAREDTGDSWFRELSSVDPDMVGRLAGAARQLPAVGERFLDFDLVGELGQGAFGRVYLARQGDHACAFPPEHPLLGDPVRVGDGLDDLVWLHLGAAGEQVCQG